MAHQKLSRTVAASVASLGLVVGLAGAAGATSMDGSISNTGHNSSNVVRSVNRNHTFIHNRNTVELNNHNSQTASSGRVNSEENTTAGTARSGDATNTNHLRATVSLNNAAGTGGLGGSSTHSSTNGSIDQTGADSSNEIVSRTTNSTVVKNDNNVEIENTNSQSARTGDVNSEENTTAGNAVSGDATNTNTAQFNVSIKN